MPEPDLPGRLAELGEKVTALTIQLGSLPVEEIRRLPAQMSVIVERVNALLEIRARVDASDRTVAGHATRIDGHALRLDALEAGNRDRTRAGRHWVTILASLIASALSALLTLLLHH